MSAPDYLIDQLRAIGQHDLADDVITTQRDWPECMGCPGCTDDGLCWPGGPDCGQF